MQPQKSSYDCVVIGAGPAGSTAAALVAEAGFRTLLVERATMPRFHVGESLMPETYWTFERLGVLDALRQSSFVRKVGVQFVGQSGRQSQPFHFTSHDPRDCARTWHVERAEFDQLLFENARKKGAECLDDTKVLDVEFAETAPATVSLRAGPDQRVAVAARVVVDASGQQTLLANRLGLRVTDPELRKVAIWGHFQGAERTGPETAELTTILHAVGKKAWFWYIPLAGDRVSVGLVADGDYLLKGQAKPSEVFQQYVASSSVMHQRLGAAECVEGLHVSKEFSYSTTRHAGDRWVLVGDAFGFIDPVYSTGVLLALRSGELAADCIAQGLKVDDLSAAQLSTWLPGFEQAIDRFRRLVRAFYTDQFSFGRFLREYPDYQGPLTDLLIGRAFTDKIEMLVDDLDDAVERASKKQ